MKTRITNLLLLPALVCVVSTAAQAATITVTSTADSGAGTLRAAIASAANGDTIDATGVSGTILLTSGELLVPNSVTIAGSGPANLAVNGNTASRVFHIGPSSTVTIASLTITNGHVSGVWPANSGAGIYNDHAMLIVSHCTLSGNSASYGGAILNDHSTLTLRNCTLSGNLAQALDGGGGGIYNYGYAGSATLTVVNCTLSDNSAPSGFGGGIYNDGYGGAARLMVSASTLTGRCIYNDGLFGSASVEIGDTILNGGGAQTIGIYYGTVTSLGYNLSDDDGFGVLTNATDQINTNPLLGPLRDNGGPTFTHAPLPGSPAIDKGKNFTASATDQRGFVRPYDNPSIPNASGGDGSDIGAFELNPPLLNIARCGNNVVLSWPINDSGYTLQTAPAVAGPFTNLPAATNPSTNPLTGPQQFYRLVQ